LILEIGLAEHAAAAAAAHCMRALHGAVTRISRAVHRRGQIVRILLLGVHHV
jgi:hypothetical protein